MLYSYATSTYMLLLSIAFTGPFLSNLVRNLELVA